MNDVAPLPEWAAGWTVMIVGLLTVLFVMLSALVERSGPIRLRHWAEKAGGRILELYGQRQRFEAFRFLLSLLARLGPVAFAWALWELFRASDVRGAWALAPVLVVLLVAVVEWLNRYLVEHHAESALRASTRLVRLLTVVLLPATWICSPFVALAEGDEDEEEVASDDEIDAFIDVGLREGILEPEDEELVRSIVDFGDTEVRSVMTPRVEMVSVSADAAPEDIVLRFFESKHARLPIYRESIDHVVGILHIRDLFEAMHRGGPFEVEKIANQPVYVPESKTLLQLLTEMQAMHQQMAIVVDEYGGVAGLVTVEDLVEEIVGDISDEHEAREAEPVDLGEGRWRLPGRTYLEDLEELFELDFDETPYETVSGLVCGELGTVPRAGEDVKVHGLLFHIEEADERRVISVVVERESAAVPAEPAAENV